MSTESNGELIRKVTRDSFVMFEHREHELSLSWRIEVRAKNFKIPFEELPKNLLGPIKESPAYKDYWHCVSIARLRHGI